METRCPSEQGEDLANGGAGLMDEHPLEAMILQILGTMLDAQLRTWLSTCPCVCDSCRQLHADLVVLLVWLNLMEEEFSDKEEIDG